MLSSQLTLLLLLKLVSGLVSSRYLSIRVRWEILDGDAFAHFYR